MTRSALRDVGKDLGQLFREGSLSGASEARLLERFVADGDALAFEALVARHRGLLLRTCHDLLGGAADAEEAFQATVVVLSRRAGSIRDRNAVGSWLHRVACRIARRQRAEAARRRAGERRAVAMRGESTPRPEPDPLVRDELRAALHDEIDRLPDRYQRPVILCLLEEMPLARAAAQLGWTEGSVRGRLARGKARLRDRLTRRGIALGAILAALAEPGPAGAATAVGLARAKAAAVLLALVALGGVAIAVAMRDDQARQPAPAAAPAPPASKLQPKPAPAPEPGSLASFRGGGPTAASRASALPPGVAARPVEFRGRVVGPSGAGVAGARLWLATDAWSEPEPQAESAADGSFRFAKTVGDFWRNFAAGGSATPHVQSVVLATHASFGAAWVDLKVVARDGTPAFGGEYPLTLHMVADRPIEGRVLGAGGAPVAGAVVRVKQLYAVPGGDLSPIVDALRRFDLQPYQATHPRVWPNHFEAAMALPTATTGADGRFTLRGVGRDRQVNLVATGPGMAPLHWTVLNRDDAVAVTEAIRARWPHVPEPARPAPAPAKDAAPSGESGVQVYGPTFDIKADLVPTVHGVVREAATGRPVPGAWISIGPDGTWGSSRTDDLGHYRIARPGGSGRLRVVVRPPEGAPLLGSLREHDGVPAAGEFTADVALARGVVVSGRAVERGTGRPMLATQSHGCHGPGDVIAGHVWYRPLAGNAATAGTEIGDFLRHALGGPHGLYVGFVGADGTFRGAVPPGPGVLLLRASPGMPFMSQMYLPWKESDGYHRRFPYALLSRRDPDDGAARPPGAAEDELPGLFGPIKLVPFVPDDEIELPPLVAYRVIEPAADAESYRVEITIPAARARRIRLVDPDGRPVRGAVVSGLAWSPIVTVVLDGDSAEVLGLDARRERRVVAKSRDGRLAGEAVFRGDSAEPIFVHMRPDPTGSPPLGVGVP